MSELFKAAQKGLRETIEYLNENKNVWDKVRDLKLYDVSFKCENPDEFNDFCSLQFEYLMEKCHDLEFTKWDNVKFKTVDKQFYEIANYIGRTSKFYLGLGYQSLKGDSIQWINENISLDLQATDIDEHGNIIYCDNFYEDQLEEIIDSIESDLEFFRDELLNQVKDIIEPYKQLAEYIDDVKENQVALYEEYKANMEEFNEE